MHDAPAAAGPPIREQDPERKVDGRIARGPRQAGTGAGKRPLLELLQASGGQLLSEETDRDVIEDLAAGRRIGLPELESELVRRSAERPPDLVEVEALPRWRAVAP